jgi:hypothetical protein
MFFSFSLMDQSKIIKPSPLCQQEIWKTIYGITAELDYIDNPWFPTVIRFTVARDSVVIEDESTKNTIELYKGLITIETKPCVMMISRNGIALFQRHNLESQEGRWVWFDKHIVPFLETEYIEAEKLYERVRYIFKTLIGHISDKLGF